MGYYQAGVTVDYKAGDEPVTIADREADRSDRPPDCEPPFLTTVCSPKNRTTIGSRLHRERVWIVDPLDGTSDFVSETGDFAVQIALAVDGKPVLGVIYQPTQNSYCTPCTAAEPIRSERADDAAARFDRRQYPPKCAW